MDFSRKSKVLKSNDKLCEQYSHVLYLYKEPPIGEISVSEFEELAFERVQVLKILEQATQLGNKIFSPEWRAAVLDYLRKLGLRRYIRLLESTGCSQADADVQIRREDYLSHFILRLAYCRSLELRNWFIAREIELFKMRFLSLSIEGVKKFITANKLDYFPITQEEKEQVKSGLYASTLGYSFVQIESIDFYKVPFTEVLDLIRNTSVYVNKGFAYIPTNELISCIVSWFWTNLSENLVAASKSLPNLRDDRILNILKTLVFGYTGNDYSTFEVNPSLTAENLHTIKNSFPLCMKNIFEIIKSKNHVKHFARLQFNLFLKGIGLNLEEAIKFWRTEFCKIIDEETFNKKYLYNIKHSYGAVGRMMSYSPYGCKKCISFEPGPSEHHGCPFKLWSSETLKQKLIEVGVNDEGVKEVVEIAKKGHYQIACTKYFMYTHDGIESKQVINHPNQFFEETQELLNPNQVEAIQRSTKKRKVQNNEENKQSTQNLTLDESIFDDGLDLSQIDDI